jgi:hypothetical protein
LNIAARLPWARTALLAVAVLWLTACGPTPAALTTSPPASPAAGATLSGRGASIKVPNGWLDRSKDQFAVAKLNKGVEGVLYLQRAGASHDYLFALRQPLSDLMAAAGGGMRPTLAQVAAFNFQEEAKSFGCDGPKNSSEGNLDAASKSTADFTCPSRSERMVVAVHGDYAYYLYFVSDNGTWSTNVATLDAILQSWQWLQ